MFIFINNLSLTPKHHNLGTDFIIIEILVIPKSMKSYVKF